MLRYDPLAPLARAEMGERLERAERARLRRDARQYGALRGRRLTVRPDPLGLARRLVCLVRGTAPIEAETCAYAGREPLSGR